MPIASTFNFCYLKGSLPWQSLEIRQLAQGQILPHAGGAEEGVAARWKGAKSSLSPGKSPAELWSGAQAVSWRPLGFGSP